MWKLSEDLVLVHIDRNKLKWIWILTNSHFLKNYLSKRLFSDKLQIFIMTHVFICQRVVEYVRNMMAHAQKPDLVFQETGRGHLSRGGGGVSSVDYWQLRSADQQIDHVPMYSARLLATHSIHIFPLNFPSHASLCAISFRMAYNTYNTFEPCGSGNCWRN